MDLDLTRLERPMRFTQEQVEELNRLLAGKTIERVELVGDCCINLITKKES